jgi:hypothetical protein
VALEFLTREDIDRYLAIEFPGHRFPSRSPRSFTPRPKATRCSWTDVVRYLRAKKVIGRDDDHWALVQTVPGDRDGSAGNGAQHDSAQGRAARPTTIAD